MGVEAADWKSPYWITLYIVHNKALTSLDIDEKISDGKIFIRLEKYLCVDICWKHFFTFVVPSEFLTTIQ